MRRILLAIGVMVGLSILVLRSVPGQSQSADRLSATGPSRQDDSKPQSAEDRSADREAIRANIEAFKKAYNAQDAKALAELFTTDGLIVDKDGDESQGRDAIAKTFAALFAADPQKRIEINVDMIQLIGPDMALETGTTDETSAPNEPPDRDRYTVIHVKRDGKWQMALARDEDDEDEVSAHDQLLPLSWLVGDWIDDGGSTVVRSSGRWSEDGNFLLLDFNLQENGRNAMKVTQRIGWDPLAKCVHSWVFDSEGGFGESLWARDGDTWIIRATGVRPDGTTASATNFLTPKGTDGYVYRSTDRVVANKRQPATEVKVVRKPPQPKE